jgi:signal peptidase II
LGAVSSRFSFCVQFILALALDRATKYWALSNLTPAREGQSAVFLSLSLHFNSGIAFSILESNPSASLALALAGVGILGFLCARCRAIQKTPGVALLWAGAIGNLTDRFALGYVIDWIYAGRFLNLADIWLCAGCLLILTQFAKSGKPSSEKI